MKIQILIIEDNEDYRFLLSRACRREGFRPIPFHNGEEALKYLRQGGQLISAILSDLDMPICSGEKFIKEVKKNKSWNAIPIILFSAEDNLEVTALRLSVNFVHKGQKRDIAAAILEIKKLI